MAHIWIASGNEQVEETRGNMPTASVGRQLVGGCQALCRSFGGATLLGVTIIALLAAAPAGADNYDANGGDDSPWFYVHGEDTPPADCPILAPGPDNSPCAGHWQECVCLPKLYRRDRDPERIHRGDEETVFGGRLDCNFCEPRCLTANPPTTPHECTQTLTVNLARAFQYEFGYGVEAGIEVLKEKFETKCGWNRSTSYSFEVTLGSSQMPSCFRSVYSLDVVVRRGEIYRIRHEYAWMDVLVESPNNICGVAGNQTYVEWNLCPTPRFSTCTSDWWLEARAGHHSEFCGAPQDLRPSNSFAPLGPDDILPLILWTLW